MIFAAVNVGEAVVSLWSVADRDADEAENYRHLVPCGPHDDVYPTNETPAQWKAAGWHVHDYTDR